MKKIVGAVLSLAIIFAILSAVSYLSEHYKDAGEIAIDRSVMNDIYYLFDNLENSHFDDTYGYDDANEAYDVLEKYITGNSDTTKEDAEDALLMLSNYLKAEKEAVEIIRNTIRYVP